MTARPTPTACARCGAALPASAASPCRRPRRTRTTSTVALAACLHVLRDNLWLVVAIACAISFLASAYALLARPVYEASMLIHVEEANPAARKTRSPKCRRCSRPRRR